MTGNLTEGNTLSKLIKFSLPFLFSYFLQTLYGLADLFIAGQFNGAEVITAIATGSQIMHTITVIIVGLAMGTTVLTGQASGAGSPDKIRSIISTSFILFIIIALIFTVTLSFSCNLIIKLMSVPEESIQQTKFYLYICFTGIPFITIYNIISSAYRGLGDSKTPMLFITSSCLLNIFLDIFFMGFLHMHADGAALATVISQLFSVIFSIAHFFIKGKKPLPELKFSFSLNDAINIIKIGLPVSCQDGLIQISFILITIIANKRGVNFAAAVGIVEKIICFLFLVPASMLASVSAMASQNIGAGKIKKAEQTLLYAIIISFSFGLISSIIFQFIADSVLSLFTRDFAVQILGVQYIKSYIFDCAFAAIHFCFSGYFCALGKSIYAFLHNIISIVLIRIPGAILASVLFPQTLFPMGLAATTGSVLSSALCLLIFLHLRKKYKKF